MQVCFFKLNLFDCTMSPYIMIKLRRVRSLFLRFLVESLTSQKGGKYCWFHSYVSMLFTFVTFFSEWTLAPYYTVIFYSDIFQCLGGKVKTVAQVVCQDTYDTIGSKKTWTFGAFVTIPYLGDFKTDQSYLLLSQMYKSFVRKDDSSLCKSLSTRPKDSDN